MLTEQLGLRGQLADEAVQVAVVWVAAGFQSQHRGGVLGHPVEVDEEVARGRVEVEEPGRVRRPLARRAACGGVQDR